MYNAANTTSYCACAKRYNNLLKHIQLLNILSCQTLVDVSVTSGHIRTTSGDVRLIRVETYAIHVGTYATHVESYTIRVDTYAIYA